MSLVGPRPERPIFVEQFRRVMPDYDLRHAVPGGMTGWAQVHGWRGRTSLRKRIQYDLDYIQRWSFWLDFRVLFMTVQHVFWGKTSLDRPTKPAEGRPAEPARLLGGHPRPTTAAPCWRPAWPASPATGPPRSPIEVIVADDASTDDTAAWLADAHPDVRLVRLERNGGFCAAANAGIAAARGEFIQLLEQRHRGHAPAGSRPAWPRSPTRRSARSPRWSWSAPTRPGSIRPATRTPWSAGRASAATARLPPTGVDHPADRVFGASGSSAFYRADGPAPASAAFDPSFGSYYEDVDLAFRLRWAGYGCVFTPACRILHEVSASYDHARPALPAPDGAERRDPVLDRPAGAAGSLAAVCRTWRSRSRRGSGGSPAAGPARSSSASSTRSANGPGSARSGVDRPDLALSAIARPHFPMSLAPLAAAATTSAGPRRAHWYASELTTSPPRRVASRW